MFGCRPNREQTGEVSPSGASLVKHGLNPSKIFMQVHYLKVRSVNTSDGSSAQMWMFKNFAGLYYVFVNHLKYLQFCIRSVVMSFLL